MARQRAKPIGCTPRPNMPISQIISFPLAQPGIAIMPGADEARARNYFALSGCTARAD
jgi:hypothetical protein